jgi:hypothetical protein
MSGDDNGIRAKLESRRAEAASPPQPIAGGSEPFQGSEIDRRPSRARSDRPAMSLPNSAVSASIGRALPSGPTAIRNVSVCPPSQSSLRRASPSSQGSAPRNVLRTSIMRPIFFSDVRSTGSGSLPPARANAAPTSTSSGRRAAYSASAMVPPTGRSAGPSRAASRNSMPSSVTRSSRRSSSSGVTSSTSVTSQSSPSDGMPNPSAGP